MIDRYHLRYFLAVIDQGNFSKAASACNVSQPTLSVGIAKLEAALGKALFNRTNRRVELTEAGGQLATYARRIEESFAAAERDVSGVNVAETIRVGVLATTPRQWIEAFFLAHRAAGTGERVEIVEGKERDLHDKLARGRIDIALTMIREPSRREGAVSLFTEGYALAMAASHPLAARPVIPAEDLVNDPMIVRRQCELLSETSRFFTARGVRPFFPARTMSDDRAISYVRAGLGITVMPECFTAAGIVRPALQDFAFTRDIGLLYAPHAKRADPLRSGPVRLLVETVERLRRD